MAGYITRLAAQEENGECEWFQKCGPIHHVFDFCPYMTCECSCIVKGCRRPLLSIFTWLKKFTIKVSNSRVTLRQLLPRAKNDWQMIATWTCHSKMRLILTLNPTNFYIACHNSQLIEFCQHGMVSGCHFAATPFMCVHCCTVVQPLLSKTKMC